MRDSKEYGDFLLSPYSYLHRPGRDMCFRAFLLARAFAQLRGLRATSHRVALPGLYATSPLLTDLLGSTSLHTLHNVGHTHLFHASRSDTFFSLVGITPSILLDLFFERWGGRQPPYALIYKRADNRSLASNA